MTIDTSYHFPTCDCRDCLREERDTLRADARMWMDRYSSLYVRVACGVAIGADEGSIFLEWEREVDAAYAIDPTASKDHDWARGEIKP